MKDNLYKIAIISSICMLVFGCSLEHHDYPDEWGKMVTTSNDKCVNISGNYVAYMPQGDPIRTSLLGYLLCSKKEEIETFPLHEYNIINIHQESTNKIDISVFKDSQHVGSYQLTENDFNCSGGTIKIKCEQREDIYFSGYQRSKVRLTKNEKGALVMHTKTFGIGVAMRIIPVVAKESYYFRYLPTNKAIPDLDQDFMTVAIPKSKSNESITSH